MKSLQIKYNDFKKKNLSKPGIGELYERQIRYIYEKNGWLVKPYGILKGRSDLGRDLLCYKKKQIHIVQAKCWSKKKMKKIIQKLTKIKFVKCIFEIFLKMPPQSCGAPSFGSQL